MPDEEGMALYEEAARVARSGLGPIVEIGTYCAKSTVYLAAGAATAGGCVFSVDHHRGSEELQPGWAHHDPEVVDRRSGRTDTLPWARRALEDAGVEDNVVLVVGESSAVARYWGCAIGMLFIDGGHSHQVVESDYLAWAPHISLGGTLAFHDVFADPAAGGQGPYQVFCSAAASSRFSPRSEQGSLRVLARA